MSKNNIAFLRRRRNLSQTRLSEMTDIPVSTLSRIESGEIASFEKHRVKLAAALGSAPEDLDADEVDAPTVPVTGIVKYKSFVKDVPPKEQDKVEHIPGLPEDARALKIKGTHLVPYHGNGDLLYYAAEPEGNDRLFLDRECLVALDTKKRGEKILAWISQGSKKGLYTVHPYSAPLIVNAKILAAHPILYVKRA